MMNRTTQCSTLILLCSSLLLASQGLSAKPEGKGKRYQPHDVSEHYRHDDDDDHGRYDRDRDRDEPWLDIAVFGERERNIIHDYYRSHPPGARQKALPPGLRKKVARGGSLPPGWQKKVARGEVLDDDLLWHAHGIPDELYGRLPRQPPGTAIIELNGKVVRLIEATRTIVDVLDL